MTRKQAVRKAAMCGSLYAFTIGELADEYLKVAEDEYLKVAERAYDLGRIAGLREAVRALKPYDDPDADCCLSAICEYFEDHAPLLTERADRLEKKARKHGK